MNRGLSRRRLLKSAAAGTLGAVVAPFVQRAAFAAGADLMICGAWELTAPGIANTAMLCDRGSKLAVETLAGKLGVAGAYSTVDTEGDPGKGVRKVGEQISQRGTKFFVGGASSAVALAVSKEVNKAGGVYVTTGGADELTGSECAKSTFRWPVATYGAVEGTVRPLRKQLPSLGLAVLSVFIIAGLRHTGHDLDLPWQAHAAVVVMVGAGLSRVLPEIGIGAFLLGAHYAISASLWSLAFVLWLAGFLPLLRQPTA